MRSARSLVRPTGFDRLLAPLHRWIWSDAERRVQKLIRFGDTETDGGRDILRAAEITSDPLLRRLYLVHAIDELRHGVLFRQRAASLLPALPPSSKRGFRADWIAPGGHGADDLDVDESDEAMLAFLHLSEKAAASRFTVYRDVMKDDPPTFAVFDEILHDETFHMNYTLVQLARVSPNDHQRRIWRARLSRLWKAYLRVAAALAGVIGGLLLTIQYFVVLPLFAWLARRAARREPRGWAPIAVEERDPLTRQY